jgi:hypothetical protein
MDCNKITADIINSCEDRPIKGIYPTAWIVGADGLQVTFDDNLITEFVPFQESFAKITATKFGLNAGFDIVASDVKQDGFKHKFTAIMAGTSAELDLMDRICVIVKNNNNQYLVYGAQNGLYKTSQTKMANDNSGLLTVNFESRQDMEEEYSEYLFDLPAELPINELLASTRVDLSDEIGPDGIVLSDEYMSVNYDGTWIRTKAYINDGATSVIVYYNTVAGYTI